MLKLEAPHLCSQPICMGDLNFRDCLGKDYSNLASIIFIIEMRTIFSEFPGIISGSVASVRASYDFG